MAKATNKATNKATKDVVEVVVTKARLDAHPEYEQLELAVGDVIEIPISEVEEYDTFPEVETPKPEPVVTSKAKKGDVALLENGKFIRRFKAEVADQAEAIAAKKEGRSVIPMSKVSVITCEYEYLNSKNDLVHGQEKFSDETYGDDFPERAVAYCNEKRGVLVFI